MEGHYILEIPFTRAFNHSEKRNRCLSIIPEVTGVSQACQKSIKLPLCIPPEEAMYEVLIPVAPEVGLCVKALEKTVWKGLTEVILNLD